MSERAAGRPRRWDGLRRRSDGGLDLVRARRRTSAFVYGNITALGAVEAVTEEATRSGRAVVVVAVTCAATFVAHVLADVVAHGIRPSGPERGEEPGDHAAAAELRDAAPIATSGLVPALLLALAGLGALGPVAAQLLASAVIVVRLASTSFVVERLSGRSASAGALWGGLALAVLSAGVAAVKAALGH